MKTFLELMRAFVLCSMLIAALVCLVAGLVTGSGPAVICGVGIVAILIALYLD